MAVNNAHTIMALERVMHHDLKREVALKGPSFAQWEPSRNLSLKTQQVNGNR
jgi:hypothetical protein